MNEKGHFYEFGPFRLDPAERLLLRHNEPVSLPPKAFETLSALVENSGHLMTKDELMKRVWPATFVEEVNLAQNVSLLRRILEGEDGERYIETVSKGGYRFTRLTRKVPRSKSASPPQIIVSPQPDSTGIRGRLHWTSWRARVGKGGALLIAGLAIVLAVTRPFSSKVADSTSRSPIRSIAVLPLVNLSADSEQEYFTDGLTDELITRLANLGSLRVISRTSIVGYKHSEKKAPRIGEELHVDCLVEGTVQRSGDRVRIRIQLIRSSSDQHIWAETYDRPLSDILQVQSEVAQTIAREIRVQLSPEEQRLLGQVKPVTPRAYELFLRGRYLWNRRNEHDLSEAVLLFQQAIATDPGYAPAYSALANSYALLGQYGSMTPNGVFPKAKDAALHAIALDETLSDAHASLALVSMLYDYDWGRTESELRRAIELNPNYATARQWYAEYLVATHRSDEALEQLTRALEADPNSLILNTAAGRPFFYAKQYDKAIAQFRRTLEMDPNFFPARGLLGRSLCQKKLYSEALEEMHKADAISPQNPIILSELAFTLARAGRRSEAQTIVQQLHIISRTKYVPAYNMALVSAGLGQRDEAIDWLNKAYQEHSTDIVHLATDPRFDDLRGEDWFQKLITRIAIPG